MITRGLLLLAAILAISGCNLYLGQEDAAYDTDTYGLRFACMEEIRVYCTDRISVTTDMEQYGRIEYWATPAETIKNGKGDCEDASLLFLFLVKKFLGFEGVLVTSTVDGNSMGHATAEVAGFRFDNSANAAVNMKVEKVYTYSQALWIAGNTHGYGLLARGLGGGGSPSP